MWYPIIACIAGVVCGLQGPIAGRPVETEAGCKIVASLALELGDFDPDKFKITCAKANEGK